MKRDIVTITLNPSIDVTLWVDGLDGDKVNRVQRERREAGGKGVNVARVTGDFGIHTCCIVVAGKDNADELHRYLDDEDLLCDMLRVDGAVRENLTLRCGGETVKINRQGPTLYSKMGAVLPAWLAERIGASSIAVFAGSMPGGLSVGQYGDMMLAAKKAGALVAVDTTALKLADYARISPWLIKPNIYELAQLADSPCDTPEQTLATARHVREVTGINHLLVSLGGDGLLYCGEGGEFRVSSPKVEVCSTVGAGDSLLAGFITGYCKGQSLSDALRLAVACGSDAVRHDGTRLATRQTAHELLSGVTITPVEK